MNTYKTKMILVLLIIVAGISEVNAQKGKINGTVIDNSSGEPLISATVSITGTTRGVVTDLDGKYNLENIDAGLYSITVSYITYTLKTITDVRVTSGETTVLNIALDPEVNELSEVVVSAESILNNDAALLRYRQKSIAFTDALSAESISRSGGSDAASAMKKVTGATVVGGKYVYVRGLGDRYSTTQLNGLELPTSDPDKKAFQLDLFPSHLLENIITLKTFTADKPGNFSGGLVDISTKGIPDDLYVTLSFKQGFNTQSSFTDILMGEKSDTDWFGMDSGYRHEPGSVASRNTSDFPSETKARFDSEVAQDLDLIAKSFNSPFLPDYVSVGLNQSYSFGLGNRHYLNDKIQLGYSANYSYSMNNSSYTNGRNSRFELLGKYEESEVLSPSLDLNDIKGSQAVDWGFLGSFGLIIGSFNKINFNYLKTQSGENTGRYLTGYWEQFNSDDIEYRSRVNQYIERDLQSFQLSGDHSFSILKDMRLDWNSAIQTNGQEQPDLRFIASEARMIRDNNGVIVDTLLGNPNSQFPRPARFFRDLNENKYSGTVDLTIPLNFGSRTLKFKTGGLYEYTERDFRERRYEYQQGRGFNLTQFGSESEYLNSVGVIGYDNRDRAQIGNYIVSATTDRSSYDASQTIQAGYAMFDLDVTRSLKLASGLRYEMTDLRSTSRDSTLNDTDRFGKIKQNDLLPSVILIYTASEKVIFRSAFSRTLARPTFREMSPYVSFDFIGDNLFRGNANLERTLISNYDLRWEWYPGSAEMISASVFYKDMENPLERVLRFDISQNAESIQNVEKGKVYGFEFEIRKNLGNLLDALKTVDITANYAWVQSEVNIPEAELIQSRQTQENPETTRQLAGQSPYVINFDIAYYNPKYAFSTNLSFNTFGDRLSRVTQGSAPDVYERSYNTLNASFQKNIGNNISLSLSASNILDPNVTYSQQFKEQEYIYQQYKTGSTYSLGIKYSFN